MKYFQAEPFGSDVEDARSALLMFLIASALGQKDITPETFLVNPKLAELANAEPDVDEDGTVPKKTIAELAKLLGADPPPP